MSKRKLDPTTLRAVVSKLRTQARKAAGSMLECRRAKNYTEALVCEGGIAALQGFGDALLVEAREVEEAGRKKAEK